MTITIAAPNMVTCGYKKQNVDSQNANLWLQNRTTQTYDIIVAAFIYLFIFFTTCDWKKQTNKQKDTFL